VCWLAWVARERPEWLIAFCLVVTAVGLCGDPIARWWSR